MRKIRFSVVGLFLCLAAGCTLGRLESTADKRDFFTNFEAFYANSPLPSLNLEDLVEIRQIETDGQELPSLAAAIDLDSMEIGPFVLYPAGMPPNLATRAAVFFDHDNFYVYFRAEKRTGYSLKAEKFEKMTEHIWYDDNFEIFIDPFASGSEYFQLIVNPLGYIYDGRCIKVREPDPAATDPSETIVRVDIDADWDSAAEAWIQEHKDFWEALVRIPFVSFELPRAPLHTTWGLNLCHTNRDNGQLSQWSLTSGARGFHQPDKFGAVFFGKRNQDDVMKTSFRAPITGYGENLLHLDVHNGPGARQAEVSITVSVPAGAEVFRASRRFKVEANEDTSLEFQYDVPFDQGPDFYVSADVRYKDSGIAFLNRRLRLGQVMSFRPDRDIFFSNVPTVPCQIHLELGEKELSRTELVIEIGNDAESHRRVIKGLRGNVLRFGINPDFFFVGENYIKASLIKNGDVLEVQTHSLGFIAPPVF